MCPSGHASWRERWCTYPLHFLFICDTWVSLHLLLSTLHESLKGTRNMTFLHELWAWRNHMFRKLVTQTSFSRKRNDENFHINYLELKLTWTKMKQIMVCTSMVDKEIHVLPVAMKHWYMYMYTCTCACLEKQSPIGVYFRCDIVFNNSSYVFQCTVCLIACTCAKVVCFHHLFLCFSCCV